MIKSLSKRGFLALFFMIASCVTVNLYFPITEAEQAARSIVQEVMTPPENASSPEASSYNLQSAPPERVTMVREGVRWWQNILIGLPRAEAASGLNVRTPVIDHLRARLHDRYHKLKPFFQSGALGFSRDGLIAIRDMGRVPLVKRVIIQQLVGEENKERNALYKEIARANNHPDWESEIRTTFAKVWIEEAPKGFWYQSEAGQWVSKE